LKLGTAKKVFKKYGKDLRIFVNDRRVAAFPRASFAKPSKFHNFAILNLNPLARITKLANASFRTKSVFEAGCINCGSLDNIEVHHVRKLRDSSRAIKSDYLTAMMSRMNRKQIPLCKKCHIYYHRGKLSIKREITG
jgi:hypothetical protein